MKLILLHGNFQTALIKKVSEIKSSFDPLAITELSQGSVGSNFSSKSLFTDKQLVILENPDVDTLEKSINANDTDLTILVRFSKTLEKSSVIFKKIVELKGEILNFDETSENTIFPFLDLIGNLNKKSYIEFEKNYDEFGGQYLLSMLAYFLRRMVQKPKTTSDFMIQKIQTQKRNFGAEKITKLYRELIETDYKIKQGLLEEKMGVTVFLHKIIN